ncbi:fasciclin domain-containing protein [Nocardiopsis terrae]
MRKTTLAAAASALALVLAACGGGDRDQAGQGAARETPQKASADVGGAAEPFGPGCSDFPGEGAGSLDEMAGQPFATAIADSPVLGNLSEALERAGLSEELDAAEELTVFAPTDDAFDMYPDGEMDDILGNPEGLAYVLNQHVIEGRVPAEELDEGAFDSRNGGLVRATASDGEYTVNGYAPVVCGDVRTANATVHVVGMLLLPS